MVWEFCKFDVNWKMGIESNNLTTRKDYLSQHIQGDD